jgi:hypothetical protein
MNSPVDMALITRVEAICLTAERHDWSNASDLRALTDLARRIVEPDAETVEKVAFVLWSHSFAMDDRSRLPEVWAKVSVSERNGHKAIARAALAAILGGE